MKDFSSVFLHGPAVLISFWPIFATVTKPKPKKGHFPLVKREADMELKDTLCNC